MWKNCKRQSSQSRDQHGLRFAVSVNPHEEAIELHVCIDATKPFFFAESRSVISV